MDRANEVASQRTDTNAGVAPEPGEGRVRRRTGWWIPASLLGLAMIPILGATGRLVEMLGGLDVLPADARFAASPVPLGIHSVAAIGYVVLGAFQFSAGIRRRHRRWHRRAGRVLVALGLAIALSGLWMTLLYPRKEGTGDILWVARLLASSGMGIAVILAFAAIRRRNIARHRAWMTRGYALALGAGTQAFTVGFGEAAFGSGVVRTDLMMTAGWAINLTLAEWIIRRRAARRPRTTPHQCGPGRVVMARRREPMRSAHCEVRLGTYLKESSTTLAVVAQERNLPHAGVCVRRQGAHPVIHRSTA